MLMESEESRENRIAWVRSLFRCGLEPFMLELLSGDRHILEPHYLEGSTRGLLKATNRALPSELWPAWAVAQQELIYFLQNSPGLSAIPPHFEPLLANAVKTLMTVLGSTADRMHLALQGCVDVVESDRPFHARRLRLAVATAERVTHGAPDSSSESSWCTQFGDGSLEVVRALAHLRGLIESAYATLRADHEQASCAFVQVIMVSTDVDIVSAWLQQADIDALTLTLERAHELAQGTDGIVSYARARRDRLLEEENALRNLEESMETRSVSSLAACISKCEEYSLRAQDIQAGKDLYAHLISATNVKRELAGAIAARDMEAIDTWLQQSEESGVDCGEDLMRQAAHLKSRLQQEEQALRTLQEAVSTFSRSGLDDGIALCDSIGLDSLEVENARKLRRRLDKAVDVKAEIACALVSQEPRDCKAIGRQLEKAYDLQLDHLNNDIVVRQAHALLQTVKAIEARSLSQLATWIQECHALSFDGPEIDTARAIYAELMIANIKRSLTVAVRSLDFETLPSLLEQADEYHLDDNEDIVSQAHALLGLKAATAARSLPDVESCIAMCCKVGLDSNTEVEIGRALQQELLVESARHDLTTALGLETRALKDIDAAIAQASSVGLSAANSPEFAAAEESRNAIFEANAAEIDAAEAEAQKQREKSFAELLAAFETGGDESFAMHFQQLRQCGAHRQQVMHIQGRQMEQASDDLLGEALDCFDSCIADVSSIVRDLNLLCKDPLGTSVSEIATAANAEMEGSTPLSLQQCMLILSGLDKALAPGEEEKPTPEPVEGENTIADSEEKIVSVVDAKEKAEVVQRVHDTSLRMADAISELFVESSVGERERLRLVEYDSSGMQASLGGARRCLQLRYDGNYSRLMNSNSLLKHRRLEHAIVAALREKHVELSAEIRVRDVREGSVILALVAIDKDTLALRGAEAGVALQKSVDDLRPKLVLSDEAGRLRMAACDVLSSAQKALDKLKDTTSDIPATDLMCLQSRAEQRVEDVQVLVNEMSQLSDLVMDHAATIQDRLLQAVATAKYVGNWFKKILDAQRDQSLFGLAVSYAEADDSIRLSDVGSIVLDRCRGLAMAHEAQKKSCPGLSLIHVSLEWTSFPDEPTDLDLYVTCPSGSTVYHRSKQSTCGSLYFDHDDFGKTSPYDPRLCLESAHSKEALPAPGAYVVAVELYRGKPVPYKVAVSVCGVPQQVLRMQAHAHRRQKHSVCELRWQTDVVGSLQACGSVVPLSDALSAQLGALASPSEQAQSRQPSKQLASRLPSKEARSDSKEAARAARATLETREVLQKLRDGQRRLRRAAARPSITKKQLAQVLAEVAGTTDPDQPAAPKVDAEASVDLQPPAAKDNDHVHIVISAPKYGMKGEPIMSNLQYVAKYSAGAYVLALETAAGDGLPSLDEDHRLFENGVFSATAWAGIVSSSQNVVRANPSCKAITLVLIDGGPVTQLESSTFQTEEFRERLLGEIQAAGCDRKITLVALQASYNDFCKQADLCNFFEVAAIADLQGYELEAVMPYYQSGHPWLTSSKRLQRGKELLHENRLEEVLQLREYGHALTCATALLHEVYQRRSNPSLNFHGQDDELRSLESRLRQAMQHVNEEYGTCDDRSVLAKLVVAAKANAPVKARRKSLARRASKSRPSKQTT